MTNTSRVNVRTETPADIASVNQVNQAAFGRDVEALLADRLREGESFVPELSLVAEFGGQVVGHAILTRASIQESPDEQGMLVLGPIGVLPEWQKQGIGSRLIEEGLRRARKMGFRAVALIGHPGYYPRFGFRPGSQFGIRSTYEVPDDVFMVSPLYDGALDGCGGLLLFPSEFAGV